MQFENIVLRAAEKLRPIDEHTADELCLYSGWMLGRRGCQPPEPRAAELTEFEDYDRITQE